MQTLPPPPHLKSMVSKQARWGGLNRGESPGRGFSPTRCLTPPLRSSVPRKWLWPRAGKRHRLWATGLPTAPEKQGASPGRESQVGEKETADAPKTKTAQEMSPPYKGRNIPPRTRPFSKRLTSDSNPKTCGGIKRQALGCFLAAET